MSQVDVLGLGEAMALFEVDEGGIGPGGSCRLRLAGAELNLLIGVARQGHRAGFATAVGADPFGDLARRTLQEQGIATHAVDVDPTRRTGMFVKEVTRDERRRVHYYRDGSAASAYAVAPALLLDRLAPRVVVLSGLTLGLGLPDGIGATAVALLREAAARGVTTVFDANLRPGIWDGDVAVAGFAELLECLDVVLAGREEMAELVAGTDPVAAAVELCASGVRGVVIKDGARGAIAVEGGEVVEVPALPVEHVVDPVGAGDAFAAGVVSGVLRGEELATAARLGAVLGAEVVRHRGDWEGLPDRDRARELLRQLPARAGAS